MDSSKKILLSSWCLLIIAVLFYCLDFFFRISPSLVVDHLMVQYHVTAIGMAGFATLFYLGYVVMQIPAGIIFDNYAPRLVLAISLIICAVSFWGFIVADYKLLGFVLRFLVGAASAFSFVGALYLADNYINREHFSLIAGVIISLGTIAASGAQVISAYLFQYFSWHMVFLLVVVLALILSGLLLFANDSRRLPVARINYASGVYWQVIKTLLTDKKLLLNAVVGGLFYLPTSIFAGLWGISFLHLQYHLSEEQCSWAIMLLFLGWAIGAPVIGFLAQRLKFDRYIIVFGAAVAAITATVFLYMPSMVASSVFWLLFIFGLASSCQVVVWTIFARFEIESGSGFAIAVTNMLIMLLAAGFHLLVGIVMNLTAEHKVIAAAAHVVRTASQVIPAASHVIPAQAGISAHKAQLIYTLADYHAALIVMPLAFVLAIVITAVMNRSRST